MILLNIDGIPGRLVRPGKISFLGKKCFGLRKKSRPCARYIKYPDMWRSFLTANKTLLSYSQSWNRLGSQTLPPNRSPKPIDCCPAFARSSTTQLCQNRLLNYSPGTWSRANPSEFCGNRLIHMLNPIFKQIVCSCMQKSLCKLVKADRYYTITGTSVMHFFK